MLFTSTIQAQSQQWWRTNGNTPQTSDYLGTSNNFPLIIKTNNIERIRIDANGLVGLGITNPQYLLDVNGRTKLRYNVYCDSLLQCSQLLVHQSIQTSTINAQYYLINGQPAVFSQWTSISPNAIAFNGDVYVNTLNAQTGISIGNFKFRNGATPPQRDTIRSDKMVSFVADKSIEFKADTIRFEKQVGIGKQPAGNVALDVNGDVAVSGKIRIGRIVSSDSLIRIGDSTLAFNQNYNRLYAVSSANGRHGVGIGASANGYGINSIAIGTSSDAKGISAITIGKNVSTNAGNNFAIVIGSGWDVINKLENTAANSVMIGANSKVPSIFIAPSNNMNEAGNIGFGINPPPVAPANYVDPVKYEFNGSVSIRNDGNASLFFGRDNLVGSGGAAEFYGEWGIQYVKSADNNNQGGGLNFWKPFQSSGVSGNGFLWLGDNGNVGVGTTVPTHKLEVTGGKVKIGNQAVLSGPHNDYIVSVDGKLVAKKLVTTQQNWADDELTKNSTLEELEQEMEYALKYYHLRDVPCEKEIIKNGIDIGQMFEIQMRKIEQLYKYVYLLKKENEKLKQKLFNKQ